METSNSFTEISKKNCASNSQITGQIKETATKIKLAHCERCNGLFFLNINSGEFLNANCKAYCCEYCGPKKAYRLQLAFTDYFKQFKHLRLFTFTFRTSIFNNTFDVQKASSQIWRRFINNLRRSTSLSNFQKNVDYVRVIEFTRKGYPHFHVFFTEYLPVQVIRGLWNNAINTVCNTKGNNGNIDVSYSGPGAKRGNHGNFTPESAAKYIAKYVLKSAQENPNRMRRWSKSGKIRLFPDKVSTNEWRFLNLRSSFLDLNTLCVTSQNLSETERKRKSFVEIVTKYFSDAGTVEILNRVNEHMCNYVEDNFL